MRQRVLQCNKLINYSNPPPAVGFRVMYSEHQLIETGYLSGNSNDDDNLDTANYKTV
jgi:hypothetical protein